MGNNISDKEKIKVMKDNIEKTEKLKIQKFYDFIFLFVIFLSCICTGLCCLKIFDTIFSLSGYYDFINYFK